MERTGKLAVIGNPESVTAFKAIGADTFSASDAYAAADILLRLKKEGYAVIFISEDLCENLDLSEDVPFPVVVPLPSGGKSGYGMKLIKSNVEKAVGVDILGIE